VLLDRRGQLTFHALCVVDVVLQEYVVPAHLAEEVDGLRRAGKIELGNIERVDRLDQQVQSALLEFLRCVAQILDKRPSQRRTVHTGRSLARKTVELRHAQRARVSDGTAHASSEFVDAVRQARDAALTGIPVAPWQVVKRQGQPVGIEAAADFLDGPGVREQELDGLEAGLRGQLESVEKRNLREQHGEVCGETWHG